MNDIETDDWEVTVWDLTIQTILSGQAAPHLIKSRHGLEEIVTHNL